MASSSSFSSSSSSSSAAALVKWNYDVFLSFRGKDTRETFVDHLYAALKQKGVHVFRDDKALDRGKQISPELLKSIEESRFSIIVFSENYAFSRWCLDELVKIMDCTEVTGGGHIALPIFYNVDPSDVRKQTGSFGEAFAKHENENLEDSVEKMQKWRIALSQAANLSGWDSRDKRESKFIQTIVKDMLRKLNPAFLNVDNDLVGIDFHLKELNIRLSIESSHDVKFLGIYGLGGIGKTTIAKAIYDNHSSHFEGRSFLANVREKSKTDEGLVSLQEQLLCDIRKGRVDQKIHNSDEGSSMIKNRLRYIKALVIVDDVDHSNQLKKLVGAQDWFGPGSRIILTTRDEHLLDVHDVIERYNVTELKPDESLELFSLKAFKQKQPKEGFLDLSKDVVNYAKGLPLALNVLSSFLCGRNKIEYWISTLLKLKEVPNKEITDVLKISYDGLDEKEKDIFLDIACFFKGKEKGYVTNILDSCGFCATIGIPVLIEKSLISLLDDNVLWMHDLVQDMGRYIGKHNRLWRNKDIRRVLNKNNNETEAIEAIMLKDMHSIIFEDWTKLNEVDRFESFEDWPELVDFKKMSNLRLLKINGWNFGQGISNLTEELRILHWKECPLNYLSLPREVVDLNLEKSCIEKLGDGRKALPHLKYIDLSYCYHLTSIPDLTRAPSVERLILFKCKKIFETQFLGNMKQLSELNLGECPITELPSTIENCARLKLLTLSECCNLVSLPSSICKLKYLEELHLNCCYKLEKLPENLGNLESLVKLRVNGCRKLEKLPENLGNLESLVKLDASRTSIKEAPPSIVRLKNLQSLSFGWVKNLKLHCFSGLCSLTELDLNYCYLSEGAIPSDIGSLSLLETLDLGENKFVSLPSSISQLSRLTTLSLEFCNRIRALPELPSSIKKLNGWNCASLERFSNTSTVFKPKNVRFDFYDCWRLDLTDALRQFQHQVRFGNSEKFNICLPGNGTIPEWFSHQSTLGMQLPSNWYNTPKLRGLAFCIVAGDSENSFGLNKLATYDVKRIHRNLPKNHVMLGYISRACLRENENQLTKAAFYDDLFDENQLKCGIRLVVYDDDN